MPSSVGDSQGQSFFSKLGTQLLELVNGVVQILDKDGSAALGNTIGLLLGPANANGVYLTRANAASGTGTLAVRTGTDAPTQGGTTAAPVQVGVLTMFSAAINAGGAGVSFGNTTSLTVGAAGAAAAPPASPETYLSIFVGVNQRKLALYLP